MAAEGGHPVIGSDPAGFMGRRAIGVRIVVLISALLSTQPASGQTSGEAHLVIVRGGDSVFHFSGLSGGGGVLLRNQVGVNAEIGLIGDNSDERDLVPVFSVGGSMHFASRQNTRKLVPFVAAGFTTLGDGPGWYAGGGANYWFRRATAVRFEFRGVVPSTDGYPRKAWFLRGGVAVGFAR
jgi:hypothetical protein